MHLEVVDFGALTDAQRDQLEGDEIDPFDAAGIALVYAPKERHVGLADAQGQLVASTGLTRSEVEVGDERFAVVGLGGVIVNAAHRGQGLARRVVEAALERAAAMGPERVVLFCHADRAGLYERLGFARVGGPVRVRQPHAYAAMPQLTMWRPLRPGVGWPDGPVVIDTLPF
jgi:predicted GNAT family N-acyltransferase